MDLKEKTYNALFWSFIDRGGEQLIRFIFSVILARLLLPQHFGLLGMAYVVTEIARVFVQGGFGFALINNANTSKIDECSVFYFNILIGALATLLIFFLAPIISNFYKSPELTPILRALSLNVIIGSFGTIQTVLMTKSIDFKAQTKVNLPATLFSGLIGILLAYMNYGVWSLVVQTILRTILSTLFLWFIHSWRPVILFSFKSLKTMFNFGSKLLMGSLVQMIFGNIYTITIGKFFSPTQLGYYTRANQTQSLALDTIWTIIGRVSFPVLSSIKNESEKFNSIVSKASCNIAFFVFPLLVIGAIVAPSLFHILFGQRWAPSVPLFQILCIANLFNPLENLKNNAILAKGNSTLIFNLQLFKYLTILGSIAFSFFFGLKGLLVVFGIISYLNFFIFSYFLKRETDYRILNQFVDIMPFLICTIVAGLAVLCVSVFKYDNDILRLSIETIVGLVVYTASNFLFKNSTLEDNFEIIHSLCFKLQQKIYKTTN